VGSELHSQIDRAPAATERLLVALTILGFVVPNVFVGIYFLDEGFDLGGYFSLWTASVPATQLLADLAIAALAFFIWAAFDGPRAGIKRWWLCIPASLLVGLCFGLPLYLLMRERAISRAGGRTAG
jgi:hypothetical protein